MKTDNVVKEKSYAFALRIVKLQNYLFTKGVDRSLSRQLLRCGTSIGANIEEAVGGQSIKDFQWKIGIAYREARETHYWLRLLYDSGYIDKREFDSIIADNEEILRIIGSIQKTVKEKMSNK